MHKSSCNTDIVQPAQIHYDAKISRMAQLLRDAGATDLLFVGGFVRDLVLGIPSKDQDLEVYGLTYREILNALRPYFHVNQVGESFSVVKVDNEIDLAIPRRERKTGVGHKAFEVVPDASMTFREAASRRDFTINAIGMRLDGTFCDPFDGLGDLKRGILRAPTEAFCEDPLRVLRGVQFAARFGFTVEPRTLDFCRRVRSEFGTLSSERLYGELEKWATKGTWPEKGLDVLCETGWLECFPLLAATVGVPWRNVSSSGEALDVWEHTRRTCVSAVQIAKEQRISKEERLVLMFAALLHGIGIPVSDSEGKTAGSCASKKAGELAESFLQNLRAPLCVSSAVKSLVCWHDVFVETAPTASSVRHLSVSLKTVGIRLWRLLASAVVNAEHEKAEHEKVVTESPSEPGAELKIGLNSEPLWFSEWLETAEELGVSECPPEPILFGRDLESLGISPGRQMGTLLREAWSAQLNGVFSNHQSGVAWLKERISCEPVPPNSKTDGV